MEYFVLTKAFFVIAIVVVVVLSLWVLISNQKSRLFGFFFIPFVIVVAFSTYVSVKSFEGYPVEDDLAGRHFTLHWYLINEPNNIWLWVIEEGASVPRAYNIPYRKGTHKNLERIRNQMMKGGAKITGFLERKVDKKGKFSPTNKSADPRNSEKDPYTWENLKPQKIAPKGRITEIDKFEERNEW